MRFSGVILSAIVVSGVFAPAALPANQIWECTTNGVRTFSNNPCGAHPTLRELNPMNVMAPTPAYRVTRTAPPQTIPPGANDAYSTQDVADPNLESYWNFTDNAYNPNVGYIVVPRVNRMRPASRRNHPRPHH